MNDLDRELKRREMSKQADIYAQAMDVALGQRNARKLATMTYLWALASAIEAFLTIGRPDFTVTDEQIERLQRILAEEQDEGEFA